MITTSTPSSDRRRRSAREWFAKCQYAYAGQYVHGINGENDYTRRGSLFHKAREFYIALLWKHRTKSDAILAAMAWQAAAQTMNIPWEHHEDARTMFVPWAERYELNLKTFYAVETNLMSHYGAELRMDEVHVPDADTLRIVDCKTYWRIPTQDELRGAFQTANYLGAARKLFPGFKRYEMVYDIVRYGITSEPVSLTDAELDEVDNYHAAQTVAMDMADAAGDFTITPGSHCGMCKLKCPLMDNPMVESDRVTTAAEATRTAQRVVVAERVASLGKAALRAYTAEHGPLSAGDVEFAHRAKETTTYPLVDVADVLTEEELDNLGLTISASAVKRITGSKKKYKAAADRLAELAIVKVGTEFTGKRTITGDDDAVENEQG